MDYDRDAIGRAIRRALKKNRGYAGFFEWPDKKTKELEIALQFANALMARGVIPKRPTKVLNTDRDPPDCEIVLESGEKYGLEVTELVDRKAIERHKRGGSADDCVEWSESKFITAVRDRVGRKDKTNTVRGGRYSRYLLLIFTDEPELPVERVKAIAAGLLLETTLVDEVWLMISYDPRCNGFPILQIPTRKQ